MHPTAKSLVERLLLHAGPAALSRRAHRGRKLVLAYHNIVPAGERVVGDESLHLQQRRFAEQLDLILESGARVIPLDALMDRSSESEDESFVSVSITFDDAYHGAVKTGVEELVRRDLPATIFVIPDLVGDQTFWWDALGSSNMAREAALRVDHGRNEGVFAWARGWGLPITTMPQHARSATLAELREAANYDGITLASHTWSHPNLTSLTEDECRLEFGRATDWLRCHFGYSPGWLSYPYGLHGATAERAASASGYHGAFAVEGGWLPRMAWELDAFRLPRLNIPAGISRDGFSLRLAGLLSG